MDNIWHNTLRDGGEIDIRQATPEDAGAVRSFLEGLSDDARWLRYHSPVPIVRTWMVDAVVRSDHVQHDALLALLDGRVIGIAEWARTGPGEPQAHVAIVVDDAYRRRGVARELMRHLAASGREHGVDAFEASVLSVNRATMELIKQTAPERTTRFDGSSIEVRIPLRATG